MLSSQRKFLLAALLLCTFGALWAQHQEFPVDEWIRQLDVKKDICAVRRTKVLNAIMNLDSASRCQAMLALEEKSLKADERVTIRVNLIKYKVSFPEFYQIIFLKK